TANGAVALVPVRVTVNVASCVPLLPSVRSEERRVGEEGGGGGTSSLMMVTVPWRLLITGPLGGPDRLTKKISFGSTFVSPLMVTVKVWALTPVANCSVPEVGM